MLAQDEVQYRCDYLDDNYVLFLAYHVLSPQCQVSGTCTGLALPLTWLQLQHCVFSIHDSENLNS